ncbi:MAG: cysteine desulfurase, partial [Deltaproteobacteria bacterium]|nr:cysteine desulfurase [Deltaproteobacteria bacterium]
LEREVHGKPLAYLDNAATSQKPRAVIDALIHYYSSYNANIHRGVHSLSEEATVAYEAARDKVRDFIRAPSSEEIVFTRGTTEAINLVAQSYLRPRIREGDEILISQMEHHSNIVPWQLVREQTGAVLKVAPINERGEIELEQFSKLLGPRTRFVALAHVSNALGTINMVQEMVRLARMRGVPVLLDGAQAVPHLPVDVQELGCDFYAFSGHKMYAPTGIGALYGRRELLEEMGPYQGGGEMILSVTFEKTTYNRVPYKFEAGTPNIAGAIGLGTAIDYLLGLDLQAVRAHEDELLEYATKEVSKIPSVRLIGTAASKTGVLSFLLGEIHAHDVGTVLDQEGIAVRTGHHCAQPVMDRFGVTATARASFAVYNTTEEVDRLVEGLHRTLEIFS